MSKKYQLDTNENKQFMKELSNDLLSFGVKFPSPSGASYYLGDDGTPWKDRPRETWITCRMAHVYSIGFLLEGKEEYRELAQKAIHGISTELHDEKNGGWYPGITAEGSIIENKQCYAHAFVILAATSGILAGCDGAKELLLDALNVYDKYFWNNEEGLACDTWNTDFTILDEYRGLNANMHTVEAFLAVSDMSKVIKSGDTILPDGELYRKRAGRIIEHVIKWAENNNFRIPEHFTSTWIPDLECNADRKADQFKPYGATPGHGIEWARLITQWALSSFNNHAITEEKKNKCLEAAERLFNQAISDAWNSDGAPGICYTTDWKGQPVVHDRMHWTLAEAINTSAILYRVTGKEIYKENYQDFMKYLDEKVLDHINGSWFHQLDQENNVLGTVWPGKSDIYHALQSTLIPYSAVDISITSAVYSI